MERRSYHPLLFLVKEVQANFKSNLDLYTVMSVDSKYLSIIMMSVLPQYENVQLLSFGLFYVVIKGI